MTRWSEGPPADIWYAHGGGSHHECPLLMWKFNYSAVNSSVVCDSLPKIYQNDLELLRLFSHETWVAIHFTACQKSQKWNETWKFLDKIDQLPPILQHQFCWWGNRIKFPPGHFNDIGAPPQFAYYFCRLRVQRRFTLTTHTHLDRPKEENHGNHQELLDFCTKLPFFTSWFSSTILWVK